jgi:hypothetical protein
VVIWHNLWSFGILNGHLAQIMVIWNIFPVLVCFDQEKSGIRGSHDQRHKQTLIILYDLLHTP